MVSGVVHARLTRGRVLLLVVVAAVVGLTGFCATRPTGEDARRILDRFEAPSTWVEVERSSRDWGCIDVDCPYARVRYEAKTAPSAAMLETLFTEAGYENATADRPCEPRPNRTGHARICEVTATSDGWDVHASVAGPGSGPMPYWISVRVNRR